MFVMLGMDPRASGWQWGESLDQASFREETLDAHLTHRHRVLTLQNHIRRRPQSVLYPS